MTPPAKKPDNSSLPTPAVAATPEATKVETPSAEPERVQISFQMPFTVINNRDLGSGTHSKATAVFLDEMRLGVSYYPKNNLFVTPTLWLKHIDFGSTEGSDNIFNLKRNFLQERTWGLKNDFGYRLTPWFSVLGSFGLGASTYASRYPLEGEETVYQGKGLKIVGSQSYFSHLQFGLGICFGGERMCLRTEYSRLGGGITYQDLDGQGNPIPGSENNFVPKGLDYGVTFDLARFFNRPPKMD